VSTPLNLGATTRYTLGVRIPQKTVPAATRTLFAFLLCAPALAAQVATARAPLELRDVLSVKSFADRGQVDLSSDGRFVAFALQDPLRKPATVSRYFSATGVPRGYEGTDIYVTEVLTSQTRNITQTIRSSNWNPVWSPDGRTLAFLSDRDGAVRVWLWTRATRQFRRLTAEPARVFFGFESIRWSPNGRRVAVKLSPLNLTRAQLDRLLPTSGTPVARRAPADSVTASVFSAAAARDSMLPAPALALDLDSTRSFLNAELADLAMIDVVTGRVKRIAPHVRVMGWQWSPDGRSLAYSTRQPDGGRGLLVYDNYDLFVVDTSGKPARLAAPRMVQEYGLNFSWSPNGRSLAYLSSGQLYTAPRDSAGGDVQTLTRDERDFSTAYRAPLWMGDTALLVQSGDTLWRVAIPSGTASPVATVEGQRLLGVVAPADAQRLARNRVTIALLDPVTKRSGFRTVDFVNGTFASRFEDQVAIGGDGPYHLDASNDGQTMAFVAERGDRPPEVWITREELTHTNRITNLNPQVTRLALGATRLIQWSGPRGEILRGALVIPGNYEPGKRFPLVVKVYGGSRLSSRLNRFGLEAGVDNLHMLSTRGYGVLLPDAPLREGTPLEDLASAVLPGVDSAVALGLADPDRLALMGHSYGGYSTLAILVQTTRFKAAISSGGFSNLFSHYTAMRDDGSAVGINWAERDQGLMGGHPWELRDQYIRNSPFFFLDKVTTPVLLLHGGSDRTVLAARAEETFVGLRRLGKTVEYVRYEGEEHHPGSWSTANAADYWNRIFDWLEKYLPPRP
jgi:dipeptidyl aminopeptidase/acylaminoacyl peptidase